MHVRNKSYIYVYIYIYIYIATFSRYIAFVY